MLRDPKLIVLLLAGSLTTMTGGVVAPVLPEIIEHLQLDTGLAANLVSVHNLTIALFSPPLGILADRIGRLKVLVPALVLYALFGVAGAFMDDFWSLLLLRALLGAASGGIAAASLGLLGSMYEGQARSQALGLATSTLTLTGITDPLLGGWVGASRWQNAFYLYGVGLAIAFLAATILKEQPRKTKSQATQPEKLRQVLLQRHTLKILIALSLTSVAMYAVVIYAPLYLNATINADTLLNGVVLASRAIGAGIISAFGASKLARRLGSSRAIALGFGLMAVTLIAIPLLHQVSWIVVSAIMFGVGFGIVLPNLYNALANLAPEQLRASVLAIGTGMGFLGQFLSPILLAPVLNYAGIEAVFYAAAAIAIATGLILLAPQQ
ncbi:MFS transporter [Chroogloeocystis siderophila]|jgi:ACDE family multidrug resistance protein|uniref:MFS transporter n=1 Tax=Chroogloeocystis siderophila 5.2 s.c.1 TaxID=247279 RepID=A0A1U7HN26_9CHRO|nr:MFS transporter [Chroogloeocystis siderophila]OKH24969.1 MFS transporter [Chroogloeocystis siderophila 5.2 s.c.1]